MLTALFDAAFRVIGKGAKGSDGDVISVRDAHLFFIRNRK
jgi:hypothetical protein